MERGLIERLYIRLESIVNKESPLNPFYHLGAIAILLLWVILFSGIYLFIFYEISVSGAYRSVEYVTREQWWLGGIMRSLHRYASDGLVLVTVLHALRVFILKRYRFWRAFAWVTGVATLWLIWISGIFGYLMVWDMKAQFIAFLSARFLESLPVLGIPVGLNFAVEKLLSDQFFYIVLFIHFSSIVVITLLLGLHVDRISRPEITPPRPILWSVLAVLLVISIVKPAVSDAMANLKRLPMDISLDVFYMFVYPLFNYLSEEAIWVLLAGATAVVVAVPWLGSRKRSEPAKVVETLCVGCELCMKDCPYTAIQMKEKEGLLVAMVTDKKCASCGICLGACEYSAIELGPLKEEAVYEKIEALCDELKEEREAPRVFVFACRWGVEAEKLLKGRKGVGLLSLECIGMVQPRMVDIVLEKGVDGLVFAGCRMEDCAYRKGNVYLEQRLDGKRAPIIKIEEPMRERVKTLWFSSEEKEEFLEEFTVFIKGLKKGVEKGEPV